MNSLEILTSKLMDDQVAARIFGDIPARANPAVLATQFVDAKAKDNSSLCLAIEAHIRNLAVTHFHIPEVLDALSVIENAIKPKRLDRSEGVVNIDKSHVREIRLTSPAPTTAASWEAVRNEINLLASQLAPFSADTRWKFIAGTWAVSCKPNVESAAAMADYLKPFKSTTKARLPSEMGCNAANLRTFTERQLAAAIERTPELIQEVA